MRTPVVVALVFCSLVSCNDTDSAVDAGADASPCGELNQPCCVIDGMYVCAEGTCEGNLCRVLP